MGGDLSKIGSQAADLAYSHDPSGQTRILGLTPGEIAMITGAALGNRQGSAGRVLAPLGGALMAHEQTGLQKYQGEQLKKSLPGQMGQIVGELYGSGMSDKVNPSAFAHLIPNSPEYTQNEYFKSNLRQQRDVATKEAIQDYQAKKPISPYQQELLKTIGVRQEQIDRHNKAMEALGDERLGQSEEFGKARLEQGNKRISQGEEIARQHIAQSQRKSDAQIAIEARREAIREENAIANQMKAYIDPTDPGFVSSSNKLKELQDNRENRIKQIGERLRGEASSMTSERESDDPLNPYAEALKRNP